MKKFRAMVLILLLCSLILPAHAAVYVDQTPPEDWAERELMRLTVFRTGEGDCMLLEANGEAMMIDGGPNKYRESLRDALYARNLSHFKYFYSTHPHDDHIDGLYRLMQYGMTADEFVSVFAADFRNDLQKRTVAQAKKSEIPFRQLTSGDTLTLGNATLILYNWEKGDTINARSPLTRIEYGDCSALLCADVSGLAQRHFLKTLDPGFFKVDVAKYPHHALTPFVTEFLDAVDPAFLYCTNYDNDKISKARSQAKYRSIPFKASGAGTIILECDGTDWYITQTLKQF